MLILAIETSCDETAIALVAAAGGLAEPKFKIKKSVVSSQIKIHRPFGGVVPMLAKREHQKNLPLVLKKVVTEKTISKIDLISVTVGPGLEPALWEGINFAKHLSRAWNKPVLGVNHLEGHIYSNWMSLKKPTLPAVCLIVSGGHTILTYMPRLTAWQILGATRDDAVGESFDKVARLARLPYPGGPEIEKIAALGDPDSIPFPRPMLNDPSFDFSYSGLKTAVLYYLRAHPKTSKKNLAASFQKAAFAPLIKKSLKAAQKFKARSILLCGGVAGNQNLRRHLRRAARANHLAFTAPSMKLNTDNAAMIAAAAYFNFLNKTRRPLSLKANGNLDI